MLRGHGVETGDRVVIIMPQDIPAMTTFVGAMMLGAVPAFLAYPNFKVEPAKYRSGLAGVTTNLSAKAVVIDEDFPDDMLGHVSLGEGTKLIRAGAEREARKDAVPLKAPEIHAESLAFIQHSAGTTGLQKGVALTHAAVLRQLGHLAHALKIDGATDCVYSWLPLYHDMGLIACFMLPMVCHIPVVMQSPLDWVMHPETMLQIIERVQVHAGVDAEFRISVRAAAHTAESLGAVRSFVAAGIDQLLRAGPRHQHARISECVRGSRRSAASPPTRWRRMSLR